MTSGPRSARRLCGRRTGRLCEPRSKLGGLQGPAAVQGGESSRGEQIDQAAERNPRDPLGPCQVISRRGPHAGASKSGIFVLFSHAQDNIVIDGQLPRKKADEFCVSVI